MVTNVVGNVTGSVSGPQTGVTSLGILTQLQVDSIFIDGNTISSTTSGGHAGGDINITPQAGHQIVLDGAINVDAGVVTNATSITSTNFSGNLAGNVTGNLNADSADARTFTAHTIGADSVTIEGVDLSSYIKSKVGAMVSNSRYHY